MQVISSALYGLAQVESAGSHLQWLSMVWDKIPMIWDIIDLANYSLDWHDDLTKSEHHGNSNVADTKN